MCKILQRVFEILLGFHGSLRGENEIGATCSSSSTVPHSLFLSTEIPRCHFNDNNVFVMDVISRHAFFSCLGLRQKPLELTGSFQFSQCQQRTSFCQICASLTFLILKNVPLTLCLWDKLTHKEPAPFSHIRNEENDSNQLFSLNQPFTLSRFVYLVKAMNIVATPQMWILWRKTIKYCLGTYVY